MALITRKHGLVELLGVGLSALRLSPGEGNFTISGLTAGQIAEQPVMDRGEFLELTEGDQTFPTGSITVYRDGPQHSASNLTIMDAILKRSGSAAASGTTSDPGGVVWTAPLRFTENRGGAVNITNLPNCRFSLDMSEAQAANTMTINYTSYGRPTFE